MSAPTETTSRLKPPTVTDRCRNNVWGSPQGHAKRGEHQCHICLAKQSAYMSWVGLKNGRSARFTRTDLQRLVVTFARTYRPGQMGAFEAAFEAGLREAVMSR